MKKRTKDLMIGASSSIFSLFILTLVLVELAQSIFGHRALIGFIVVGWIIIGLLGLMLWMILISRKIPGPKTSILLAGETSDERRRRQWGEYKEYLATRKPRDFLHEFFLDSADFTKGIFRGEGKYMGRLIRTSAYSAIFFFVLALLTKMREVLS
jgi:hypothetical protein